MGRGFYLLLYRSALSKIIVSFPSTIDLSRHQDEMFIVMIVLEAHQNEHKKTKIKRHCPHWNQGRAIIVYHTIEIVTAKPKMTVSRADTCSAGSGSIWGSPDSWLSPPQPHSNHHSLPGHILDSGFILGQHTGFDPMGWPWTSRLIMISHGPLPLFDPL